MTANVLTLIRSSAGVLNRSLQGKKRWVSLLGYLLLAVATVAGIPLDDLARDIALDPEIDKDTTLIAIVTAAGITFRFFQSIGRNRDLNKEIVEIKRRIERRGL